jgi:hypothetical protein
LQKIDPIAGADTGVGSMSLSPLAPNAWQSV